MQLAHISTRPPHLVQTLEALARRGNNQEAAQILLDELSGINVLVARRFTNERTADGLLDAFHLTVGCISLGISQANLPEDDDAKLSFLLTHGAEYVFQMGFRHIKELAGLPYTAFVSDFDRDPQIQQRDIKLLFAEICRADPASAWTGDNSYRTQLLDRQNILKIIDCAKWLRRHHYAGPIRDSDMDAHAVIAIAVIFSILGDGRIVARTGQGEIESLIHRVRESHPDVDSGWTDLLRKVPPEYQPILRAQMEECRNTIIRKLLSRTSAKTVLVEIQKNYAGDEQDIDYH